LVIKKITKRNDIQIYRGISVLAVILYHLSPVSFPGGYLGVDIFFVISGFVISNLIFSEIDAQKFSFKNFYLRRFRRIIPSVLSFTIFVQILLFFIEDNKEIYEISKGLIYSLFFTANIYLSRVVDYFNFQNTENYIVNLWSLSVEEQFYLIFPVILICLTKKSLHFRVVTIFFITAFSLLFFNRSFFDNFLFIDNVFLNFDNFLFYSPFTRFWQFSIGVICMLLNQIRSYSVTVSEKYIPLFSIGFLYFLSQFSLTSGRIFSSALITLIFTVILYVEISFKKVNLLTRTFLYFGNISYSLYLFHQPIFASIRKYQIYSRSEAFLNLSSFSGLILTFICIFLVSFLNYELIENKFRHQSPNNRNIKHLLAPVIFLAFLLPSIGILTDGYNFLNRNDLSQYPSNSPLNFLVGTNFIKNENSLCLGRDIKELCIYNERLNDDQKIYFVGDSIIGSLVAGFVENSNYENYTFIDSTKGSCPLLFNYCDFENNSERFEFISQIRNSTIIFGGNYEKFVYDENFEEDFKHTIEHFDKSNTIFLINSVPYPGTNVKLYERFNKKIFKTEYTAVKNQNTRLKKWFNETGDSNNITTVNIDSLFCNDFCIFQDKNYYFFNDHSHFSYFGSKKVSDYIYTLIKN
jgi:peptidoglycan/LPS O-acetylase OafA/YrhL